MININEVVHYYTADYRVRQLKRPHYKNCNICEMTQEL